MRMLRWILISVVLVVLAVVGFGRAGFLAGSAPKALGVQDGRLVAPSTTPNSVSSQADLYPDHPQRDYARVAPLRYAGNGAAAMAKLAAVLRQTDGATIVTERPDYIQVRFETALLRFNDDAEFWLDSAPGLIQVRSASRIGQSDLGVNRQRIESIRNRFAQ